MATRYRLNVDFDNTIIPFLYEGTGEYTFTVPSSPNFMGSRYVVFLPAVLVLNDISMIPAISGYTRIEGGIPLTGEFRTIAAADYETLLLKDAIEFPAASAGATLTMTNFYTIGSTVDPSVDDPTHIITADATLENNSVNYIEASAVVILTLPVESLKGETIRIIDTTGFGFKLKRGDFTTQTIRYQSGQINPHPTFNEYITNYYTYSSWLLYCVDANTEWQEVSADQVTLIRGAGYFAGGFKPDFNSTAIIEKLLFSLETLSVLSATLNAARRAGAALSSVTKGYVLAGNAGGMVVSIESLIFSTETKATVSETLDSTTYLPGYFQNQSSGYILGGGDGGSTTKNIIQKLIFQTEIASIISSVLPAALAGGAGMTSIESGFLAGGVDNSTQYSAIRELLFSSEIVSTLSNSLSGVRSHAGGVSDVNKGFIAGGNSSGFARSSYIEKLNFVLKTVSALSASLSTVKPYPGTCSSTLKGYVTGGQTGDSSATNSIDALIFTSETRATLTAVLSTARSMIMGFQGIV